MEGRTFEFSFFNAPITNKTPLRTVTLQQVAKALKSNWLERQTTELRTIADKEEARR